jgi:hypothetical protein
VQLVTAKLVFTKVAWIRMPSANVAKRLEHIRLSLLSYAMLKQHSIEVAGYYFIMKFSPIGSRVQKNVEI